MKKNIVAFILLLLSACPAFAAVSFDAVSHSVQSGGTTLSFDHTVGAGSNQILVVGIGFRNNFGPYLISSVTYNGTAMTRSAKNFSYSTGNNGQALYYLLAPTQGTHSVSITIASETQFEAGAISLNDAAQRRPDVKAANINGVPVSITTLNDGAMTVDISSGYGHASTPTVTGDQTLRWFEDSNNGGDGHHTAMGTTAKTTAGSVSIDYSFDVNYGPASSVISVEPFGSSSPDTITITNTDKTLSQSGYTLTLSGFSVTGDHPYLVVGVSCDTQSNTDGNDVTAATYNGVALTLSDHVEGLNTGNMTWWVDHWLYYLTNPATGSHDISVTLQNANGGAVACTMAAIALDNTSQEAPETHGTGAMHEAPGQSVTLTTTTANSIIVSVGGGNDCTGASCYCDSVLQSYFADEEFSNQMSCTADIWSVSSYQFARTAGAHTTGVWWMSGIDLNAIAALSVKPYAGGGGGGSDLNAALQNVILKNAILK